MSSPRTNLGALADRANSFDALRLLAAVAVIFTHSYALSRGHSRGDALRPVFEYESLSHVGVAIFFAISGFLVTRSWVRRPRLRQFAVNRVLRLIPALAVASAVLALIVGPLVTSDSPGAYLSSSQTWGYVGLNSVLDIQYTLPGVFTDLPYADVVNGSLWTLPLEGRAYVAVGLLGLLGLLSTRFRIIPVLLLLALIGISLDGVRSLLEPAATLGDALGGRTFLEYYALFACGAALFLWRERVPITWPLVALAAAAWLLSAGVVGSGEGVHLIATVLLLPYVVIGVAYLSGDRLTRPLRGVDASYGVYVYAFPIQQLLVGWLVLAPLALFALATPLALIVGIGSWLLVERRALALKHHPAVRRLTGARRPPVEERRLRAKLPEAAPARAD